MNIISYYLLDIDISNYLSKIKKVISPKLPPEFLRLDKNELDSYLVDSESLYSKLTISSVLKTLS